MSKARDESGDYQVTPVEMDKVVEPDMDRLRRVWDLCQMLEQSAKLKKNKGSTVLQKSSVLRIPPMLPIARRSDDSTSEGSTTPTRHRESSSCASHGEPAEVSETDQTPTKLQRPEHQRKVLVLKRQRSMAAQDDGQLHEAQPPSTLMKMEVPSQNTGILDAPGSQCCAPEPKRKRRLTIVGACV